MYCDNNWFLEQDLAKETLLIWQELTNLMAELCQTPAGFIVQMTKDGYQIVIANQAKENPLPAGLVIAADTHIFCRKVVEENKPLYVKNATQLKEWQTSPEVAEYEFNSYLGFPITWPNGKMFGTICIVDYQITQYDDRYFRLLEHFKLMVERELKLLEKNLTVEHLSLHDDLTGLLNRRGLKSKISEHIKLANRHNEDIAVCYYDLDELKKINDNYGHEMGDNVIKTFAHALEESLRTTDITARFGGDEFIAVICIEHTNELARINNRLQSLLSNSKLKIDINYSIGKVIINNKSLLNIDIEKTICQADKLMYENKRSKYSDSRYSNG